MIIIIIIVIIITVPFALRQNESRFIRLGGGITRSSEVAEGPRDFWCRMTVDITIVSETVVHVCDGDVQLL